MSENITLKDVLTLDEISESAQLLQDILNKSDEVVVDATGVKKVDTAALQMFVAAQKECRGNGKTLTFRVSPAISELLSLTGIQFET